VRALLPAVVLAFLVAAPAAAASGGYVEVLDANGHVVASATGSRFDYPTGGSLVHVGRAFVTSAGVELDQVSLLNGALSAETLVVPLGRHAIQLDGLVADGQQVQATPDMLVPLTGGVGYAIVAQQAIVPQAGVGRVGFRVVLQKPVDGAQAGTQVLVGLPYAPVQTTAQTVSRSTQSHAASPLAVLGFAPDHAFPGFVPPPAGLTPFVTAPGTIGERAVTIAERFLGVPYVWGGADPLTGFDCSGLVMYVYAQLGIPLTHYTGSQFQEGVPVPPNALAPGDIVFFDGNPPQHEGLYIGDGQFIQAPHTGDVVRISSLNDPEYGLRYVGAVRPYTN
jgi:cell wall-associated NlpC family hydrolase